MLQLELKLGTEKNGKRLLMESTNDMKNFAKSCFVQAMEGRKVKATKEQAAEWFETIHPPGPAAREMYRMAAEALREPDEPLKNGRSQEHFEELRNLISDMSVVEIASHIETDNLSEYLGIWRYHAQKELLSIRQLFLEEDKL
jgi:hypothetical protein